MLHRDRVTHRRGDATCTAWPLTKLGTDPSMPARAGGTDDCATREFAKDLPQEMESIRDHLRLQPRNADLEGWVGRPLLVLQPSFQQTQLLLGSIVPRSPWPQPQDDTCHLRGALHTSIRCPLVLPRTQCHPQRRRGVPEAVRAHLRVMSTAN